MGFCLELLTIWTNKLSLLKYFKTLQNPQCKVAMRQPKIIHMAFRREQLLIGCCLLARCTRCLLNTVGLVESQIWGQVVVNEAACVRES